MNEAFEKLLQRAEQLMARIESVLPQPLGAPDWQASHAFRYRKRSTGHGALEPVRHVATISLDDLQEIDGQKDRIRQNTELRSPCFKVMPVSAATRRSRSPASSLSREVRKKINMKG